MDAAGNNPAASLPAPPEAAATKRSRVIFWKHTESALSQMGLLRALLVFYSKMEEGTVILF